jgi:Zn-dependent M28 family amino/carboxypeptidase
LVNGSGVSHGRVGYIAAMSRRSFVVVAAALSLWAAACSSKSEAPAGPMPVSKLPDVDGAAALGHIKVLASDQFEGRLPGTRGEELTIDYLTRQFKAAGLEPGNPDGTFIQKVPLIGIAPGEPSPLVVEGAAQKLSFAPIDEVVAFSQRATESIALEHSDIVFVGYGVQAPELQWDDFKGESVKGKTIVVLVNDPPVPDPKSPGQLDPKMFGGKAMTYYGRWTYKYDKAAELGAAAVLIVHETGPAGYPFTVVQGFGTERFDLVAADKNMGRAAVQGWLSLDAATRLFAAAGLDYQKLKAQAATREFKPVSLDLKASISFHQTLRTVESRNVVARLTGSDPSLKNEFVVYTAHWDHLGIGKPHAGSPDKIYNGAVDNASGTSAVLEIARAMKKATPPPKRSFLFMAVTAEEQGLLGSEYYCKSPLYPLSKTLANINSDSNMPMWGRTRDVVVVGLGASDLDDYLRDAAKEQGRTLKPDEEPEKGSYYRSDHFNFAKVGVPSLNVKAGIDYRDRPAGFGKERREAYTAHDYHAPSDQPNPGWTTDGYAEQAKLLLAVGYRIAMAPKFPEWKPGNEFRAAGEARLHKSK